MGRLLTTLVCLLCCASLTRAASERQLVCLNIIATDNHGEPVTDLASSDLQISDEGNAQQILYFRRIDRRSVTTPALAPNDLSNRTAATIPHATVILFDLMNTQLSASAFAAHELTRYLMSLESGDYLYLYLLTADARIYPVHGLDAQQQPGKQPWTKGSKGLIDQARKAVVRAAPANLNVDTRIQWTLNALSAMGAALARVPGRKNIIWVTDGVPIEMRAAGSGAVQLMDALPAIRQLSLALERFQIAIYPVRITTIGGWQIVPEG
jgi:VWFA-related protein